MNTYYTNGWFALPPPAIDAGPALSDRVTHLMAEAVAVVENNATVAAMKRSMVEFERKYAAYEANCQPFYDMVFKGGIL